LFLSLQEMGNGLVILSLSIVGGAGNGFISVLVDTVCRCGDLSILSEIMGIEH
jgi:hypothetical protein